MLLAILAVWFGYKKARDTGRNAILWGAISGVSFIAAQLLVSFGAGLVLGVGTELWGWREDLYDDYAVFITLGALVAGIATILIIFRFLDRVPDQPVVIEPPPPPIFTDEGS